MKTTIVATLLFVSSCYCAANPLPVADSTNIMADTLLITRNDIRYFETEYDSKNHLSFHEVTVISDSARTIRIELIFDESMGTILKIFNPYSKQLVYKAELYAPRKNKYIETSTVPVFPKVTSFEH